MTTATDRITRNPEICGGDACVRGHRIPVWLLVQWRQMGRTDDWILSGYPGLTVADLVAACEYAAAHPEEIETAIRENSESDTVDRLPN